MRKRVTFLGVVVAVALAIVGVATVAAQTGGGGSASPVGGFVERLAANLGIGDDELRAAIDKTHDEMIDDAVAQGKLSPDAAEALKERDPGERFGPPHGFDFHFKRGEGPGVAPFSRGDLLGPNGPLAKALGPVATVAGTDVQTLIEGLKSGQSLEQIAGEHGVSPEQLRDRLSEDFRSRLDDWMGRPLPFKFESDWRKPPRELISGRGRLSSARRTRCAEDVRGSRRRSEGIAKRGYYLSVMREADGEQLSPESAIERRQLRVPERHEVAAHGRLVSPRNRAGQRLAQIATSHVVSSPSQ